MRPGSQSLALVLGALLALGGAAPLAAAPGPLISGCATLSSPGAYQLTRDVATSASGACISIIAPDVKLELGGHTLTGPGQAIAGGSVGVYIAPAATDARVVDGTVTGFYYGVADDGPGAIIQGVTARANRVLGIVVGDVTIGSGGVCGACGPIPVNGSRLVNDRALDNTAGIALNDASATTVANSTTSGNLAQGIAIGFRSSRDRVDANTSNNNLGQGILVDVGATANQLASNTATGNFVDLKDNNPNCDSNQWVSNTFGTANQGCID